MYFSASFAAMDGYVIMLQPVICNQYLVMEWFHGNIFKGEGVHWPLIFLSDFLECRHGCWVLTFILVHDSFENANYMQRLMEKWNGKLYLWWQHAATRSDLHSLISNISLLCRNKILLQFHIVFIILMCSKPNLNLNRKLDVIQ